MASVWPKRRPTASGSTRFSVVYRLGGRESSVRYAGTFETKREALTRKAWVAGELAALRVPDLRLVAPETAAESVRTAW